MNFIAKLKRFFRRVNMPGLMNYIVAAMVVVFIGDYVSGFQISPLLGFFREDIFSGQVWRIITFMGLPVNYSPFWAIITLMFYYGIGRDLEAAWGSRNVTGYLLLGTVFTVIGGFISGYAVNIYLLMSLFCAYAMILPEDIFMIFFVIPCKAKWLAAADAVFMGFTLIFGTFSQRMSVASAVGVFLVFFGSEFTSFIGNKWRHRDFIRIMRRKNIRVQKGGKNEKNH